jgi:hypothetical protein
MPITDPYYSAPLTPETEEMLIASSIMWVVKFINGTYYRCHKVTREIQVFAAGMGVPLRWTRVLGETRGIEEAFLREFPNQFRPSMTS